MQLKEIAGVIRTVTCANLPLSPRDSVESCGFVVLIRGATATSIMASKLCPLLLLSPDGAGHLILFTRFRIIKPFWNWWLCHQLSPTLSSKTFLLLLAPLSFETSHPDHPYLLVSLVFTDNFHLCHQLPQCHVFFSEL
jgi:hypothetical protein